MDKLVGKTIQTRMKIKNEWSALNVVKKECRVLVFIGGRIPKKIAIIAECRMEVTCSRSCDFNVPTNANKSRS